MVNGVGKNFVDIGVRKRWRKRSDFAEEGHEKAPSVLIVWLHAQAAM